MDMETKNRWLERLLAVSLAAFAFGVATGVSKIEQLELVLPSPWASVAPILARAGFIGVVGGSCGLIFYGIAWIIVNRGGG
jgi:hypothetical protein